MANAQKQARAKQKKERNTAARNATTEGQTKVPTRSSSRRRAAVTPSDPADLPIEQNKPRPKPRPVSKKRKQSDEADELDELPSQLSRGVDPSSSLSSILVSESPDRFIAVESLLGLSGSSVELGTVGSKSAPHTVSPTPHISDSETLDSEELEHTGRLEGPAGDDSDEILSNADESEDGDALPMVPYAIPYKAGALETVRICSGSSWASVRHAIAEVLIQEPRDIDIGYKISTEPQNRKPRRLSSAQGLAELFAHLKEVMNQAKKSKSKKSPKEVEVIITDLSEPAVAKGRAKKDKSNKTSKRNRKDSDDENSDDEQVSVPRKQAEHFARLEELHSCDAHVGKTCLVKPTGQHHALTHEELSIWSFLLLAGKHTSYDKPPEKLRLFDDQP
ncbi:hypothetical protein PUNSTDRAFT_130413 [Punctularia strigosozonata HHB-11173 SS5]|uniref:uncharacterized protein n=1 Tax=Punctularia strigosozonata (strain HHB-11173) TaxID=741275 RepID=UPI0004416645|nr:uncharacterized protein PUNSTDRAFT_130413 [Punctularia strigosozonata HHB-11173 SS5]EIN12145.1 hypothetical protein PUNSTDRAFT_130413 [Punctularia strigosozonata HHB-11173 SS5]